MRLRYVSTAAMPPRKSAVARMRMTKTIRCRYVGTADAAGEIEEVMSRVEIERWMQRLDMLEDVGRLRFPDYRGGPVLEEESRLAMRLVERDEKTRKKG